jgi:hypothetical protein
LNEDEDVEKCRGETVYVYKKQRLIRCGIGTLPCLSLIRVPSIVSLSLLPTFARRQTSTQEEQGGRRMDETINKGGCEMIRAEDNAA